MRVINDKKTMREWSREQRADKQSVALVPTMGYLHAGHLQLVSAAQACAKLVVVSIYVNPTQFAPHEDFGTYPADRERDYRCAD